jgi:fructosamine-3-kinase
VKPLPGSVRSSIERALEAARGKPVAVLGSKPVSGGCVNPSARVETSSGDAFFVKWNAGAPRELFDAEADGLAALGTYAERCGLRVPEVLGVGSGAEGEPPWLLLELIERGHEAADYGERLGRGLARLHGSAGHGGQSYGWTRDNFIGALPQTNPPIESWAEFWRDARLLPQLEAARRAGHFRGDADRTMDQLLARVHRALEAVEAQRPALLHGDLWSGNAYPGPNGEPVLIDPAVYRGHREVDLAMSELFGGFPASFLLAYEEVWPLGPGYLRVRRPLYQLYYLLVHVNLFGGGYVGSALRAAGEVVREV